MVPNIMPYVSSKQPLVSVTTGDTDFDFRTGSEDVGVKALVAACRGTLALGHDASEQLE